MDNTQQNSTFTNSDRELLQELVKNSREQSKTLSEQSNTLSEQGKILNEQGNTLSEQGKTLADHWKTLEELVKITNENTEVLHFMQDNMVMREEFDEFKIIMETRLTSIESELITIRSELNNIKNRLEKLERRTKEDSDAYARDILDLKQRVRELERSIHRLQSTRQLIPA